MTVSLRRFGALCGIVAVLAVPPSAAAEPTDSVSYGPGTQSLANLGSSDTIWFDARRDTTASTFSFIVPQGMTPTTLNATIELPVNLQSGAITATQDGRTLSRMALPLKDQAQLVIPLTGIKATDNWASVTLTVTAVPVNDTYCWDPQSPIRLVNSSISFSGNETPPTTVASFLPPTLRKLTIAVPSRPSQAESEAAIQLAAAMTTRFGWMNTDIGVAALGDGATTLPAMGADERQIVVKEGPDKEKGLFLQPTGALPALLITGPGKELTNQTRMLTDMSLPFALSTKAVAGPLVTEQKPVADTTTLDKLKLGVLSAEALRPEVNIKIDQSAFAQPIAGLRVHILGSHTPLARDFNGELTASVGDTMVGRWPVNEAGTIDHWVDIPDVAVQRTTILKVRLQTTGDPGQCNDYLNIVLRIDDDTEVQALRASPPVPPGFRALPQALLPRVQIGLGSNVMADTVRAAQIVVGLQRNSTMPLITTVSSLKEAIGSRDPAILISADGWNDQTLTLPFNSNLGRITIGTVDNSGTFRNLTLDPAIKYGSLQTLFDGQRSVLIATSNGAAPQLDVLLDWLAAKPGRWADLDGRAVISVPGNDPVTVPNRRTDLPDTETRDTGPSIEKWIWRGAGAVAAAALIGAVLILWRTSRSRARGSESLAAASGPADETETETDTE